MSEWAPCLKCGTQRENMCACSNPDCTDFIRHNIAIPTTGNREQDEALLRDFTVSQDFLDRGLCPNNDGGKMVEAEPGEWHCTVCPFVQFRRSL